MRLRMATPSACACACSASDNNSELFCIGVNESLRTRGGGDGEVSIDDEGDECICLEGVELDGDETGPPTCAWRFPRCICCSNKDNLRGVREGEEERMEFEIELALKLADSVCDGRGC